MANRKDCWSRATIYFFSSFQISKPLTEFLEFFAQTSRLCININPSLDFGWQTKSSYTILDVIASKLKLRWWVIVDTQRGQCKDESFWRQFSHMLCPDRHMYMGADKGSMHTGHSMESSTSFITFSSLIACIAMFTLEFAQVYNKKLSSLTKCEITSFSRKHSLFLLEDWMTFRSCFVWWISKDQIQSLIMEECLGDCFRSSNPPE